MTEVFVRGNDIDGAIAKFKNMVARDGILKRVIDRMTGLSHCKRDKIRKKIKSAENRRKKHEREREKGTR